MKERQVPSEDLRVWMVEIRLPATLSRTERRSEEAEPRRRRISSRWASSRLFNHRQLEPLRSREVGLTGY